MPTAKMFGWLYSRYTYNNFYICFTLWKTSYEYSYLAYEAKITDRLYALANTTDRLYSLVKTTDLLAVLFSEDYWLDVLFSEDY